MVYTITYVKISICWIFPNSQDSLAIPCTTVGFRVAMPSPRLESVAAGSLLSMNDQRTFCAFVPVPLTIPGHS